MARVQEVRLTYAAYRSLPEDGRRYEILDGELAVSPSGTYSHKKIVTNLLRLIWAWLEDHPEGEATTAPLDVILADDTIVQPDIIYITNKRMPETASAWIHGVPDLVVEVASPSTRARDLSTKRQLYARFGVREYWLADPETKVLTILALSGRRYRQLAAGSGDTALASQVLPGLSIVPARIFRGA